MSLSAIRSIFEPVEDTIDKIRGENRWIFRASQIFCLVSLLVVQSSLFGTFGSASFSGLSLLLYLVIIWEALWIVLLLTDGPLDFFSEYPIAGFGMKIVAAFQGLLIITLIVGWFGFGPAASEFITGSTAQKILEDEAVTAKSFSGHWRRKVHSGGGAMEELVDVHVSGKNFVIVKKTEVVQRTTIHRDGQLTEIINIVAAGKRDVSSEQAVPAVLRLQMFWLASDDLAQAADQTNSPVSRSATLFARDEKSAASLGSLKEWVDNETKLVLQREQGFGDVGETMEFISLEVAPVPESVFNPELY